MSHGFNEARVKVAHPYLTMMGLYLGGFTGMFSETCLNIALPQLGVAFGVDTAITQWLVIGYMLVIGLVMPFASILMKWFSVRKLTLFSLGAFIAGSLVSGCAPANADCYDDERVANDELVQAMRTTAEIAVPMPNIPEMDVMWTVVSNLLTDVNLSGEDVDAAFDEALSEAESLIANMQ